MKSKMLSFIVAAVMIINVFGIIPQNVGQSSSSLGRSEKFEISIPQNEGKSNSNGTMGLPLSSISAPIPQIVGQPSSSLSESGGLADSPWPMFRQNLNHTGLSSYDTSKNNGKLKWSFNAGVSISSSPAIDSSGVIYIGCGDDKLYAINPDGTEKWNFTTDDRIRSSPAIGSEGIIYVGSSDNKLYAIFPNGTLKWSFSAGSWIASSPTIGNDGTIYVGSGDKSLYAINSDGTLKWNFITGDYVNSSPAISSDGTIYVGSYDHNLYAINSDGTKKWSFSTGAFIDSSPTIDSNGTIYIPANDNKLYAINPDGSEKWNFNGNFGSMSPGIGNDGSIYVGSGENKLFAINPDGTDKWNFNTEGILGSSPAIGNDGTIFIGSFDYKIYAINPKGTEKWNFTTGNIIISSPAIGSDGTIYIGSFDGNLYAIGASNIPPIAITGPDHSIDEGDLVQFNGSASYDPDGTTESYEWDFDTSDGLWWENGATPDATGLTPTHIYGDDGIYVATLRVTDNDNLSATDTCNITVQNVDPTVSIKCATMQAEIGLKVAGRKYNDVSMTLYEDENSLGSVSIERLPGSPNIQMAWIPVSIDFSKSYSANVTFIPEDPPNVGANPVWIYIKSENGTINQIHHTFNVQQSKKRNSEHWNHVEPWEVELNPHFIGLDFEITSHVIDPGSDDETLTYTYGSQIVTVDYLNNPPNLDPYPSPEVNPRDFIDTTILVYEGPGTITLVAQDDDNIRLGVGQGIDSFDI